MARRALPLLPALLLAAVALHQVWAARTHDLTPWKGGGFGMFASADIGPARRLEVWLVRDATRVRVAIPESVRDLAAAARHLPTEARLAELGREAGRALGRSGGVYRALRVEAWRIRFDADLAPAWELLRRVEVAPP